MSSTRQLLGKSTRSLIVLFTLIFALTTTGCASSTTRSLDVPRSTERCPEPPAPLEGKDGKALMRKLIELAGLYTQCKAINDAKADFEEGKHGDNR